MTAVQRIHPANQQRMPARPNPKARPSVRPPDTHPPTYLPTYLHLYIPTYIPGHVAQSVTCLATYASLIADSLGVANSITAWSHTFVEIDHEIFSTVILIPSAESSKKVC